MTFRTITVPGQPGHLAEVLAVCFPSTPPVENSKPLGGPLGADGQGVCTTPCQRHLDGAACACVSVQAVNPIKRGSLVIRNGDEYRVRSKVGRVVELETLSGAFAFTTLASLCQVAA